MTEAPAPVAEAPSEADESLAPLEAHVAARPPEPETVLLVSDVDDLLDFALGEARDGEPGR